MDKAAEIEKLKQKRIMLFNEYKDKEKASEKRSVQKKFNRVTEKLRKLTRNNIYR